MYILGPSLITAIAGDFIRFSWIIFLQSKDQALSVFTKFHAKVKYIISLQYMLSRVMGLVKLSLCLGICRVKVLIIDLHALIVLNMVECCHNRIVDIGISLLIRSDVPKKYWTYPFRYECLL